MRSGHFSRCDTADLIAQATEALAQITIEPTNESERSTTAELLQTDQSVSPQPLSPDYVEPTRSSPNKGVYSTAF